MASVQSGNSCPNSTPALGGGPQLRLELAPHSPHMAGLSSSEALSPRLPAREKPAEPWVWTVGSHLPTCSPLSAPTSSRPPLGTEGSVQVRACSQTPSPRGKGRSRNRPSTAPTSLHHHSDHRHVSWSWTAWGQSQLHHSGCSTLDKMSFPLL